MLAAMTRPRPLHTVAQTAAAVSAVPDALDRARTVLTEGVRAVNTTTRVLAVVSGVALILAVVALVVAVRSDAA